MDIASLMTTDALISLLTLTAMEIVLGIDNIIFIAILVARLPAAQAARTRKLGISLALILRLALLFSLTWIMGLKEPFFSIFSHGFSGRDLILLGGGLFLIAKATHEIHVKLEGATDALAPASDTGHKKTSPKGAAVLIQILLLDIVFSLDSVITAVGMAQQIAVMVLAMIIAVGVMLVAAAPLSDFIEKHPTLKILALSFLLLIGVMLLVEGMGGHVSKGYIYFAMAFSLFVEFLNMRYRKKQQPLHLRDAAHLPKSR